eukprot:sb/3476371/
MNYPIILMSVLNYPLYHFSTGTKMNTDDYEALNNIRNAVVSYVCGKTTSCSGLTRFVVQENQLENEILSSKESAAADVAVEKSGEAVVLAKSGDIGESTVVMAKSTVVETSEKTVADE